MDTPVCDVSTGTGVCTVSGILLVVSHEGPSVVTCGGALLSYSLQQAPYPVP